MACLKSTQGPGAASLPGTLRGVQLLRICLTLCRRAFSILGQGKHVCHHLPSFISCSSDAQRKANLSTQSQISQNRLILQLGTCEQAVTQGTIIFKILFAMVVLPSLFQSLFSNLFLLKCRSLIISYYSFQVYLYFNWYQMLSSSSISQTVQK